MTDGSQQHAQPTAQPDHHGSGLAVGVALLAAGEGARMGGVPKCLIRIAGQTLLQRSLAALRVAGAARIVVVSGHYADAIEAAVRLEAGEALGAADEPGTVHIVRNPAPERGQQTSVRLGLQALAGQGLDVVVVALADQPLVGAVEVHELLTAYAARPDGCRVVYPEVEGQRGNPVAIDAALVAEVLAAGGSGGGGQGGLRGWIDAHPAAVHRYRTANRHFITDLDTRDDVQRLASALGQDVLLPSV